MNLPNTIPKDRLNSLLAKLRASQISQSIPQVTAKPMDTSTSESPTLSPPTDTISILSSIPAIPSHSLGETTDKHGNIITYNTLQSQFISLASEGASCVLIGAAGTGKTTCQKGVVQALITSGSAGILDSQGHKHLISDTPGIVICAYTRRAVSNIRKNVSLDMQSNCITIHKLLEYAPVYNEVWDSEKCEYRTKMSFEPSRNSANPLPASIRTLIFEESSMIGLDLYKEVIDALPHSPQLIFLGDIQQLPPVFGPAILGFKLTSLPTVELTEVYRQALESPIIRLAHRILSAKSIPASEFPQWKTPNQLTLHPWKKRIEPIAALNTAAMFFCAAFDAKQYDPEEDIILIPFNKSFGTDELNKSIANHLAKKSGALVHQVIAGFNKYHFAIGDKVLYDKEDAIIKDIQPNPLYQGAAYAKASPTLDYWGHESDLNNSYRDDNEVDFLLSQVAKTEAESGDRVRTASHIITLEMQESESQIKIDKASDINALLLGYCLTVHKSQGSEWRKVFFLSHQSHATMLQRELIYTAVTRAKEELYIICEPDMLIKGIENQRVKGNTLSEKAEYFKGKLDANTDYSWITSH
jgi:AAA domain/UvrD-like helicase C-terminal domain